MAAPKIEVECSRRAPRSAKVALTKGSLRAFGQWVLKRRFLRQERVQVPRDRQLTLQRAEATRSHLRNQLLRGLQVAPKTASSLADSQGLGESLKMATQKFSSTRKPQTSRRLHLSRYRRLHWSAGQVLRRTAPEFGGCCRQTRGPRRPTGRPTRRGTLLVELRPKTVTSPRRCPP